MPRRAPTATRRARPVPAEPAERCGDPATASRAALATARVAAHSRHRRGAWSEACHCAIMRAPEEGEAQGGPDEAEEHVPLRVPGIALGAEKRLPDVGRDEVGRPPLDELVERGDREDDAEEEEGEPAAAPERG